MVKEETHTLQVAVARVVDGRLQCDHGEPVLLDSPLGRTPMAPWWGSFCLWPIPGAGGPVGGGSAGFADAKWGRKGWVEGVLMLRPC